MMTQTHILVAAGMFAKPGDKTRSIVALLGGFFPDFMLSALFIVSRLQGVSMEIIFTQLYWSERWVALMAPGNSFVVYSLAAAIGVGLLKSSSGWQRIGQLIVVFSISALAHVATDFLLHAQDARAQFWPLSDWVFYSPVSYWDARYYGNWFIPVEMLLALILLLIVYARFRSRTAGVWLVLVALVYALPPLVFH